LRSFFLHNSFVVSSFELFVGVASILFFFCRLRFRFGFGWVRKRETERASARERAVALFWSSSTQGPLQVTFSVEEIFSTTTNSFLHQWVLESSSTLLVLVCFHCFCDFLKEGELNVFVSNNKFIVTWEAGCTSCRVLHTSPISCGEAPMPFPYHSGHGRIAGSIPWTFWSLQLNFQQQSALQGTLYSVCFECCIGENSQACKTLVTNQPFIIWKRKESDSLTSMYAPVSCLNKKFWEST
jgi:hypothetical protein